MLNCDDLLAHVAGLNLIVLPERIEKNPLGSPRSILRDGRYAPSSG